jgi:hypothetical protein
MERVGGLAAADTARLKVYQKIVEGDIGLWSHTQNWVVVQCASFASLVQNPSFAKSASEAW